MCSRVTTECECSRVAPGCVLSCLTRHTAVEHSHLHNRRTYIQATGEALEDDVTVSPSHVVPGLTRAGAGWYAGGARRAQGQLLGVALCSLQGGLGESTILALSSRYTNARASLTAWASGTGFAGVFGYVDQTILGRTVQTPPVPGGVL